MEKLIILALSIALTACGGSDGELTPVTPPQAMEVKVVQSAVPLTIETDVLEFMSYDPATKRSVLTAIHVRGYPLNGSQIAKVEATFNDDKTLLLYTLYAGVPTVCRPDVMDCTVWPWAVFSTDALPAGRHLLDVLLTDGVGNTKRLHIFFNKP